jgi:hypothetical protein
MTRPFRIAWGTALLVGSAVAASPHVSASQIPEGEGFATPQLEVGGCEVFPSDNPWNADVSGADVHEDSDDFIDTLDGIGGNFLHPDFGGNRRYGIPFVTVGPDRKPVKIKFTAYGHESDPGPYPVPLNAPIEGGRRSKGDRHVLAVQRETCRLYELYRAFPQKDKKRWKAASGATFDLGSNEMRPDCWTSADAAGLPILPGLVRYDEVAAGEIDHALRFTVEQTRRAFLHPATHYASSNDGAQWLPMGARLRLPAEYDISGFDPDVQVILQALKTYGMIVADNGSNWFITGAADERWDDDILTELKSVPASEFEVLEWESEDLFTEADC